MAGPRAMRGAWHGARVRRGAFTLIELLVVISIVAMLMAILIPALSRVRRQARAMVCRAHQRQWGMLEAMYLSENEGRFPSTYTFDSVRFSSGAADSLVPDLGADERLDGIQCCPAASRLASPDGASSVGLPPGGTFLGWGRHWPKAEARGRGEVFAYGSYAWNMALMPYGWEQSTSWNTAYVRGAERIPVQSDGAISYAIWESSSSPPPCQPMPSLAVVDASHVPEATVCMNRHDGGINTLFLDFSVRKIGLKELWTLKWNRQYNTAGPWTTAGGVEPQDWPQWMRKFKDY